MSDLISRQAAIDAITEIDDGFNCDIYTNEVREILRELPSVQERKGRWKMLSKQSARCTACGKIQFTHGIDETMKGHIFYGIYRYCPNCGAHMEGAEDETN